MTTQQEVEIFPFEELPLEIQEQIIREHHETIPAITRSSRSLYATSHDPYIKEFCVQPPTWSEVRNYIQSQPKIFGLFYNRPMKLEMPQIEIYLSTPSSSPSEKMLTLTQSIALKTDEIVTMYDIGISSYQWKNFIPDIRKHKILYDIYFSLSDEPYEMEESRLLNELEDQYVPVISSPESEEDLRSIDEIRNEEARARSNIYPGPTKPQLDLLSQYHIFSQRSGCIKRDPDYPKKAILKQLDDTYEQYRQNPSVPFIVGTYSYFHLQSQIFELGPMPRIDSIYGVLYTEDREPIIRPISQDPEVYAEQINNEERKIAEMASSIEEVYPNIREAIMRL